MPPSGLPRRSQRAENAAAARRPPPPSPRSVSHLEETSARETDSHLGSRRRAANASFVAASARTAENNCDAPRGDGRSGAQPVAGAVACLPLGGVEARGGRTAASGDHRAPRAVGAGNANVPQMPATAGTTSPRPLSVAGGVDSSPSPLPHQGPGMHVAGGPSRLSAPRPRHVSARLCRCPSWEMARHQPRCRALSWLPPWCTCTGACGGR